MSYERSFPVRWSDLDANRHVKNTAYSEMGTHLRFTYLAENGFGQDKFQALQMGPVIFREETRFHKEVTAGDTLTVTLELVARSSVGRWHLRHRVLRSDGEHAATVDVEGAWLDLTARRLKRPPPQLATLLDQLALTVND